MASYLKPSKLSKSERSSQPLVSVLIPHFGGREILQECLKSLINSVYLNLEIIVVDNASPDNSTHSFQEKYPDIKLIHSKYNRGFSGGCNFGAEYAKGEYLLILNNDTVHEKDWIIYLVQYMESNKNISAVQPKIKNFKNQDYFDYAGGSGGYMDK